LGLRDWSAVDYPDYARKVATAVAEGVCEKGILTGGTGQGMAMTANKPRAMRAAVCQDTYSARMSRERNWKRTVHGRKDRRSSTAIRGCHHLARSRVLWRGAAQPTNGQDLEPRTRMTRAGPSGFVPVLSLDDPGLV
jgi:hypothetical protein